jgi:[CysO sulfur-carrier protein]-thiocarboxylate-dependent cysteine synthase
VVYPDVLATIGNTPLVELRRLSPKPSIRIFAKLEGQNPTGSLKDRIARSMIEEGERCGELVPGKMILEPSSGNTGIALAVIGRLKGYPIKIVMPENASVERRQLLELFGAEIVLSEGSKGSNGAIDRAWELVKEEPGRYFMPYQYGNQANPGAHYATTGLEIVQDLPEVDVFVAGLGTGGTLMGVGRRLKDHNPKIQVIAVEPEQGDLVQGLRSLEDGFVPPVLDQSLLDSKILVSSRDAIRRTRQLKDQEGIFAGPSCGAVLHAALRVAEGMERGKIVVILADGGWKYLSEDLWTRDLDQLEDDLEAKLLW